MKELVDYNPIHRRWTYAETCPHTNDMVVSEVFDKSKGVEAVERARALSDVVDKTGDHRLVASIPAMVLHEWMVKYGVNAFDPNHEDGVKRLLNDPDYRYLRINHIIL